MPKDRQQEDGEKLWLKLQINEPYKLDDQEAWVVTAVAFVSKRGHKPMQGSKVKFYVNQDDKYTPIPTDGMGRATFSVTLPEGAWTIDAQVVGGPTNAQEAKTVVLRPEKPKEPKTKAVPKDLLVTYSGSFGKQKLLISVEDAEGKLIPGFVGEILEGNGKTSEFKTNEHGYTAHQLNFKDPNFYIEVRAGNDPNLCWRASLLGPMKPKKSPQLAPLAP